MIREAFPYTPDFYSRIKHGLKRILHKILPREKSELERTAEYELKRAGLFDKDSDYGGMIGHAVMKMVKVFCDEGHSGFSAEMTTRILERVLRYKTLTPLTNKSDEWMEVSNNTFQSRRCPSIFSVDNLKSAYSIDDSKRKKYGFDNKGKWMGKV